MNPLERIAVMLPGATLLALCARAQNPPAAAPPVPRMTLPGPANPIPPGPFAPTWESIRANYRPPQWLADAKFGIFIHWGLYAVPAHGSEWYARHMYTTPAVIQWHTEHFGPPSKFGYKDFIPRFTAERFNGEVVVLNARLQAESGGSGSD
jgi:alpha-L-fucosidase